MKKQGTSKKVEAVIRVTPIQVLMGQVFYHSEANEHDVNAFSTAEFDAFALSFVGEITGVKRDIWDVFARARFLNWLIDEGDIAVRKEGEKIIFTEVKEELIISPAPDSEMASEAV